MIKYARGYNQFLSADFLIIPFTRTHSESRVIQVRQAAQKNPPPLPEGDTST
jgi:hypothetical protein